MRIEFRTSHQHCCQRRDGRQSQSHPGGGGSPSAARATPKPAASVSNAGLPRTSWPCIHASAKLARSLQPPSMVPRKLRRRLTGCLCGEASGVCGPGPSALSPMSNSRGPCEPSGVSGAAGSARGDSGIMSEFLTCRGGSGRASSAGVAAVSGTCGDCSSYTSRWSRSSLRTKAWSPWSWTSSARTRSRFTDMAFDRPASSSISCSE
mmetsp:Transcript_162/g.359  ORF Transcript_162/g.359 Transcript_162/m.359 type:complete len:207 (-) Transcript_162:60-680(-)